MREDQAGLLLDLGPIAPLERQHHERGATCPVLVAWTHECHRLLFLHAGPMVVETHAPSEVFELNPGDTFMVPLDPARRAYHVIGKNGPHVSSAGAASTASSRRLAPRPL